LFNLKLHHCNTLLTLNNESENKMTTPNDQYFSAVYELYQYKINKLEEAGWRTGQALDIIEGKKPKSLEKQLASEAYWKKRAVAEQRREAKWEQAVELYYNQ
jgi:GTPase involved in cell partitioning and DNA repair